MAEEVKDAQDESFTTTVIAGIAVAVLAPELLPGMAIGVGAMLAPKLLPTLGGALRPIVKTAVRAGYATAMKTKELAAVASEQVQDMVAEAVAEQESKERGAAHRSSRPTARRHNAA
ncbi:MAG TPA: DUF5132 domain-containing protein [Candidatus Binatia bacterium]|jgi:Protein of unknown function (DUF5132)